MQNYLHKHMISPQEKEELIAESEKVFFETGFLFMKNHCGIRPGVIHMLVGSTGSGKSSTIRGIQYDFMKYNPSSKILVYLSEEGIKDYFTSWARVGKPNFTVDVRVMSEKTNPEIGNDVYKSLRSAIEEFRPNLLIFDNITTSKPYRNNSNSEQAAFVNKLKILTEEFSDQKNPMATFLIAHTGKGKYDNSNHILTGDDVRGDNYTNMAAEFLYILQTFKGEHEWYPTLRVEKARGYKPGGIFYLRYKDSTKCIVNDEVLDQESFKHYNNQRLKL